MTVQSHARPFGAAILDIDGVVLDSPHEVAWRAALEGFADPGRFTPAMYQAHVAGKPRMVGARAALAALDVADAAARAKPYAVAKQARLAALIEAGRFTTFPDAVRFIGRLRAAGLLLAAASSSKNAAGMLRRVAAGEGRSLLDLFDADVCGRDLRQGKPHPEIFLIAAAELGVAPARCLVVEDAPAGVAAAVAGGMRCVGVARTGEGGFGKGGEAALLREAGAGLVVASLDAVSVAGLAEGCLRQWREGEG